MPNNKTLEGRYELKVMAINNVMTTECNGVYGLTGTFPSYEEISKGYIKN